MTAVRRTQLARLCVWISLATLAVILVVFVARTESGIRRIATLLMPAEAARTSKAPQLATQVVEQRRLAEAVRALTADRDRLAARLTVLERNLDEVTGSIPPAAAAQKSPALPVPSVTASPLPVPATPAPPAQASQPALNNQARVAAGHLATGTSPAIRRSMACGRCGARSNPASPRCSTACVRSSRFARGRSRVRSNSG
jgi:hypothetical protein